MVSRNTGLVSIALLLLAIAGPGRAENDAPSLKSESVLRPGPGSEEVSGFLVSGTAAEVLETRGDWVRIRVEGWVRAAALGDAALPTAGGTLPPGPRPPIIVAEIHDTGVVEGEIAPSIRGLKRSAPAGLSCWLLPSGTSFARDDPGADDERLALIEQEIARLQRAASRAMAGESFSESVREADRLKEQRDELLDDRRSILAARHGRHEAHARQNAVAHAVADARGWFSFHGVPAGHYAVYVRLTTDELDVEWHEPLTVEEGTARVDLDERNAHGLLEPPD